MEVPFLCCRFVEEDTERVELPFVQYAKCVLSLGEMIKALGRVRLRCAIRDSGEDGGEVSRSVIENDWKVAGERFEAISFQSALSSLHIPRESIAVHSSSTKLLWNRKQIQVSRFFRESGT